MAEVRFEQAPWTVGGVAKAWKEWYRITSDPHILDMVKYGIEIEFKSLPMQEDPVETHVNQTLAVHLDNEVKKFLDRGIIVPTEKEQGDFYSTVFL